MLSAIEPAIPTFEPPAPEVAEVRKVSVGASAACKARTFTPAPACVAAPR
jgi:hypothetical protein